MASKCHIDHCQRPIACLCRHCHQDLCLKHFNEHQTQMNERMTLFADQLNRLTQKVQFDEKMSLIVQLKQRRQIQQERIDREFQREVNEFKKSLSKANEEINRVVLLVSQSIKEGETTIEEINRVEEMIEAAEGKIDRLIGPFRTAERRYSGRSRLFGRDVISLIIDLKAMSLSIRLKPMYLSAAECPKVFLDHLTGAENLAESLIELVSPDYLSSFIQIVERFFDGQSLFISIIAEISSLSSDNLYERIDYFVEFLDSFLKLHSNETYRHVIEKHLDEIVYADLTDYFLSYPLQVQIPVMAIICKTSFLHFPLIRHQSEADQSKIDLFLQDAARYLYSSSSCQLYRQLVLRPENSFSSQESILRALIIGCIFLPLTCHSGFLNETYQLLSAQPQLLTLTTVETFYHVLSPTGINQVYSVPRVYLCQLLIVRLFNLPEYFSEILQICFVIYLRVPQIRIHLMDLIEPLSETKGFEQFLDQQQQEFDSSRQGNHQDVSILEPMFRQVHEHVKRIFRLKQLCRMKIRSALAKNARHEDILSQVNRLDDLSEKNRRYLTYNLQVLLQDPDRFYTSTRPMNEPVWNSSIPPPPVN